MTVIVLFIGCLLLDLPVLASSSGSGMSLLALPPARLHRDHDKKNQTAEQRCKLFITKESKQCCESCLLLPSTRLPHAEQTMLLHTVI